MTLSLMRFSRLPDVTRSFILKTPLWLEAISRHPSLHQPLPVVDHPGLSLLPASSRV